MPESDIASDIQRSIRWVGAATVLLYLLLGGAVVYVWHDSSTTRDALCALRGDLAQRVASSEAFLREHPDGIVGIPPASIRSGIANQKRTIETLSSLKCSD